MFRIIAPISRTEVSETLAKAVCEKIQSSIENSKGWTLLKEMAKKDTVALLTIWKNRSVSGAIASAKELAKALDKKPSELKEHELQYRGGEVVKLPTPKATPKKATPKK